MIIKKHKRIIRLIVLIIAAVILWFLYRWGGNLLKPVAIYQIKQLTGARVDINDITFHLNGRISIKNISIGPPVKLTPDNAILTAKRLDAYFSPWSFLKLSPKLNRLKISDFSLNIQYNADERLWNVAALKPPAERKGELLPEFVFKRGEIKFTQINKGKEIETISCKTNGGYAQAVNKNGDLLFTITENYPKKNAGNRILIQWTKKEIQEISIGGYLPRLNIELFGSKCDINSFYSKITIDKDNITFGKSSVAIGQQTVIDVNGTIKDYKTDPAFVFGVKMKDLSVKYAPADNVFAHGSRIFESFIPMLQIFFDNFNPQGLLDIDVVLSGKVKEIAKTQVRGYLGCKDISIQYFEFPYLVEHLAGRINVTENSMTMQDVKAAHGKVDISMNGYCQGFGETMDSNVVLSSNNMLLDEELYAALVPNHKKLWYIFSPTGMVSGDFIYIAKPPDTRRLMLRGDLLGVSIICHYFPYPVTGITGKIFVDGGLIDLKDIVSKQNNGTIKMQGHITDANTPNPEYDFKILANDVAIDNKLIGAFPEEQKKFFDDFEIQAKGDADIYIHSVDNNEMPIDYMAKLNIRGDLIKHTKLTEPLKNITLDANLTPSSFDIKKFNADFNTSPIIASGTIWTGSEAEPAGYCINLSAGNLELDSNAVKPFLKETEKKLIEDFKFAGPVTLETVVNKNARIKCPEFQVAVDCNNNTAFLSKFNLPLENITGRIVIRPEDVELVSLSAAPVLNESAENPGKITLDGKIKMIEGDVESAQIKLNAVDLSIAPEFTALMGKAENYYDKLAPQGKFDLNFERITLNKNDSGEKIIDFDGIALFKDCSVGNTKMISNIYAILNIDSEYSLEKGMKDCKLLLDLQSLSFKGRPIENLKLKIPYDINDPKIVIKDFVGDCLGGRIAGDAIIESDSNGSFANYQIDLALAGVGTEQFISGRSAPDTGGTTNGELHIRGDFRNPQVNIGRFIAEAKGLKPRDAGIMSQIRNAILEAINKDLAFDNVKIQAVMKGKIVYISRFDLYGSTASLRGTGTYEPATDEINVEFKGYSGAGKEEPTFLESMTAGLQAAFLKVQMTGKLENPTIKVEPLPIFKQSLEIIGTK